MTGMMEKEMETTIVFWGLYRDIILTTGIAEHIVVGVILGSYSLLPYLLSTSK